MSDFSQFDALLDDILADAGREGGADRQRMVKQLASRVFERVLEPGVLAASRDRNQREEGRGEASAPKTLSPFPAPPFFNLETLEALLRYCADQNASGIHFAPGKPVTVNLHGYMRAVTERCLSHDEVVAIARLLHNTQAPALVLSGQPIRTAYTFRHNQQPYRFRLQMTAVEESFTAGVHIAARVLPPAPPSFADLGLPPALRKALLAHSGGLIIVTGPTGSGKTTLLASTLTALAQQRACNFVTYEDPIEFVLPPVFPSGAITHQTEVGRDVKTWEEAVTTALRREPHVAMIGELLDYTVLKAIHRLCLTGHLCLTTLHATGFPAALSTLFDMFPDNVKRQGLSGLLHGLQLVVSQHLIPTVDGTRTAVYEFVPFNQAVRERLQDTTTVELTARGLAADYGYRFKDSLQDKFTSGLISEAVYRHYLRELCEIHY